MATSQDFKVKNGLTVATTATIQSTTNSVSTTTGALQVAGGAGIGGSIYGGGNLTLISSSAKTITFAANTGSGDFSTNNVTINLGNPLGGNPPLTSTINFRAWSGGAGGSISYTNGSAGLAITVNSTGGDLTLASSAGTAITIPRSTINTQFAGTATFQSNASATSTTTGALQVVGGVGIGGKLYVGGLANNTSSYIVYYNTATGELGYGANSGGSGSVSPYSGIFTITNTTVSTSTSTGALQVRGGIGVADSVYVGNRVGFVGTTQASVVYQFYNTATNSLDTVFG